MQSHICKKKKKKKRSNLSVNFPLRVKAKQLTNVLINHSFIFQRDSQDISSLFFIIKVPNN